MNMLDRLNKYIDNDEFEIHIYKEYIHIINYKKINYFSNNKINIDNIEINGKDLVITKLMKDELNIIGTIKEVIL